MFETTWGMCYYRLLNTMLEKGTATSFLVRWQLCCMLQVTIETFFGETRRANNNCFEVRGPWGCLTKMQNESLEYLLKEFGLLFVVSACHGHDTFLFRNSLLTFGLKLGCAATDQKEMCDSFLHQNYADMTLTLKVHGFIKLLNMHRVKYLFDKCQCFGCLNFDRLVLPSFQIFIFCCIPPRHSNHIWLCIIIKSLYI